MRSDAFDQQRELRMKGGWRGGGRLLVVVVGRRGFGDESAEDGRDNDSGRRWEQTLMEMMMMVMTKPRRCWWRC